MRNGLFRKAVQVDEEGTYVEHDGRKLYAKELPRCGLFVNLLVSCRNSVAKVLLLDGTTIPIALPATAGM
jgi:hypothetical protein